MPRDGGSTSRGAFAGFFAPRRPLSHASAPGRAGAAGGEGWVVLILFAACLCAASLPLFVTDTPPLFDYPNHLARVDAIRRFGESALIQANFRLGDFLLPNVLSDLLLLAGMAIWEPRDAGRVLLLLTFALTLGGLLVLSRVVAGRWSPWPLLASVFLTNEMFFWGFLNYNLGLAILPWALAAAVALDGKPAWRRVSVGAAFAVLIFLAHLVAFGLYAVAVAALELAHAWRNRQESFEAVCRRAAITAVQFVPALLLYWGLSAANDLPLDLRFNFDAWSKWAPYSRVLSSGNAGMDTPVLVAALLIAAIGLLTGRAGFSGRLVLVALAFAVLVRILPYAAKGSFFVDSRIVIAVAFVLTASLVPFRMGRAGIAAFGLAILALTGIRATVLAEDWRAQGRAIGKVLAAFDRLPEGALLVPASGRWFELGDWRTTRWTKPAHEHTAAYAMIDHDVIVPSLFARPGQNPLEYAPPTPVMGSLGRSPIFRVMNEADFGFFTAEVRAVANENASLDQPFSGVFAILFYRPCEDWPDDLDVRPVACGPDFSLVEIPPEPPAAASDEDTAPTGASQ